MGWIMSDQTSQMRLDGTVSSTRVDHCRKDDMDVYIGRGDHGDSHLLNTLIGDRGWLGNPYLKDESKSRYSITVGRLC